MEGSTWSATPVEPDLGLTGRHHCCHGVCGDLTSAGRQVLLQLSPSSVTMDAESDYVTGN